MCVCVYVYVRVRVRMSVRVRVRVHIHLHVHIYVYVHLCMCVWCLSPPLLFCFALFFWMQWALFLFLQSQNKVQKTRPQFCAVIKEPIFLLSRDHSHFSLQGQQSPW